MENALKSAGWGGCDRVFCVGVAEKKKAILKQHIYI